MTPGVHDQGRSPRAALTESEDFPHLVQGLDAVVRKLGGTARQWRFDGTAAVCPSSGQVTAVFAAVVKFSDFGGQFAALVLHLWVGSECLTRYTPLPVQILRC